MDIVTHAGIGLIAAAPLLDSRPDLALGIVAGSVLPDLDALSRIFGKRAFLRAHQTWSHAIPVQAGVSILTGCVAQMLGIKGIALGAGLLTGFLGHSLLDFTNTLGVTLLAPFSRRRFCLEWVFFLDAVVLLLTLVAVCFTIWKFARDGEVPASVAVAYFSALAGFVGAKGILRTRAGSLALDATSLMPSASCPWRFFGVVDGKNRVQLFQVNAITGTRKTLREQEVFDAQYAALLAGVPEFTLMRGLSPAFHVVNAKKTERGELVFCRDLRTRNFGTTFGDLEVLIGPERQVQSVKFYV